MASPGRCVASPNACPITMRNDECRWWCYVMLSGPRSLFCLRPLPVAECNPPAREIVRRQFDRHSVSRQHPNVVLAHFTGQVTKDRVSTFQFHGKHRVWKRLDHLAIHGKRVGCLARRAGLGLARPLLRGSRRSSVNWFLCHVHLPYGGGSVHPNGQHSRMIDDGPSRYRSFPPRSDSAHPGRSQRTNAVGNPRRMGSDVARTCTESRRGDDGWLASRAVDYQGADRKSERVNQAQRGRRRCTPIANKRMNPVSPNPRAL